MASLGKGKGHRTYVALSRFQRKKERKRGVWREERVEKKKKKNRETKGPSQFLNQTLLSTGSITAALPLTFAVQRYSFYESG
ncbi:hypothetical protein IE53DRAFT_387783 [Violaceomyces palustris]|uniref:Uncharacterized protein n=1 Tax=Violaceomyces palustris TaxID=1673888 RepID=A0ACD0NVW8_9BASI|nr:hypothetical protein IE53DRAFT_387783 [Violaceomyces palustris]